MNSNNIGMHRADLAPSLLDGAAAAGQHADFKLAAAGEQVMLIASDANSNALLDSVTFGPQGADRSYARLASDSSR